MKYTIMGFLQRKLGELNLDMVDALILRYFVDFKDSKTMKSEVVEGKAYYWVHYDSVLRELPILNMKKCTVQARFFKLREAGVLSHYVKREGGTFSYFALGERYYDLISNGSKEDINLVHEGVCSKAEDIDFKNENIDFKNEDIGLKNEDIGLKDEDIDFNNENIDFKNEEIYPKAEDIDPKDKNIYPKDMDNNPREEKPQGCGEKPITKNPSTKDSVINSLNPSSLEGRAGDKALFAKEAVEYLNKATGKTFRTNTKATMRHINARVKEGFTLEDFKKVVDNMVFHWTGTRFQQYLTPQTLFASKFEAYLQRDRTLGEEFSEGKGVYGKGRGYNPLGDKGTSFKDNSSLKKSSNEVVNLDLKEEL